MQSQSYNIETHGVDSQVVTSTWVNQVDRGQTKEAADTGTRLTRGLLREYSQARKIWNPEVIGPDRLTTSLTSDQGMVVCRKEPDSVAVTLPLYGSGESEIFRDSAYPVYFGKIEGQRFQKDIFEMQIQGYDIRKVLADNAIKDMGAQELLHLRNAAEVCLTEIPANVITAPAWNSAAFVSLFQAQIEGRKGRGAMLMPESCLYEAMNLPATQIGDQPAAEHYANGTPVTASLWGTPVVTTIHKDIVAPQAGASWSIYLFAPQDALGNAFMLRDATLFIEQKETKIFFHTYEVYGGTIGDARGVRRLDIA